MNIEYIQLIDKIKEKHPHIICKQRNKPLTKPVFCENCCEWIGLRKDYFDHCNNCGIKFNASKFEHYDICEYADKWFDIIKQNRNNEKG
jgi:hypothetical protein